MLVVCIDVLGSTYSLTLADPGIKVHLVQRVRLPIH